MSTNNIYNKIFINKIKGDLNMGFLKKRKINKLLKQSESFNNLLIITKKVIELRESKQLNTKKLRKFLIKTKKKNNKTLAKLKKLQGE